MNPLFHTAIALLAASASVHAGAADTLDYTYVPRAGVHETRYFHGCYDGTDIDQRTRVQVVMQGLRRTDVTVLTRPLVAGQPSSELITLRVNGSDASFSLQFRSNDGPHCQQGVHSIAFRDRVVHSAAQLMAM